MLHFDLFDNQFASENYYKLLGFIFATTEEDLDTDSRYVLFALNVNELLTGEYDFAFLTKKINAEVNRLISAYPKMEVFIPVLDFNHVHQRYSEEKVTEYLSNQILLLDSDSIIFSNVPTAIVKTLIGRIPRGDKDRMFWRRKQFCLFYTYETDKANNRIYYTEIFGGVNRNEYKLLMVKLISTHLTFEDYQTSGPNKIFSVGTIENLSASPLFINTAGIVQNFEVIILSADKTLFEHSMEYILNTDIYELKNDFAGYMIKNSHFRLGSKVHIRDFVYAKRIFQNSFFTNRFAFLIAKYIVARYPSVYSLTIIGYGMYSQLLINRVSSILLKHIKNPGVTINYDMVSDAEDPHLIRNVQFNKWVLAIVPINTTFSTTVKIENLIKAKIGNDKEIKPLYPSVNAILVTHGNFNDPNYIRKLNLTFSRKSVQSGDKLISTSPYQILKWKKIRPLKQLVTVTTNPPDSEERIQKYLISIPSVLYLPESCPLCFPDNDLEERKQQELHEEVLLETDKTSVTPDLLLNLPESFKISLDLVDNDIFLNEEALIQGHVIYKGNHFTHFIKPEAFFHTYINQIEQWAATLRLQMLRMSPELHSSGVLLISAGDRNNTYFTDFINRQIFDDSGVIIHYDIALQSTENFVKFFSPHIWQATYIFYVDDILQGGKTLLKINDLVNYCNANNPKKKKINRGLDGVFTIISKTPSYTRDNISAHLTDVFKLPDKETPNKIRYSAFFYLNIDTVSRGQCPECKTRTKNISLSESCVLDSVKHYFLDKAAKLTAINIADVFQSAEIENTSSWYRYNPLVSEFKKFPWNSDSSDETKTFWRHFETGRLPKKGYLRLLVTHQLNYIFSNVGDIRKGFSKLLKYDRPRSAVEINMLFTRLLNEVKIRAPFDNWYKSFDMYLTLLYDEIIEELIVKILTEAPLNNIKEIKEKIFLKINLDLDQLLSEYESKPFSFKDFRKIKFLIKRSALLGSNYPIHIKTLKKIKRIYDEYLPNVPAFEKRRKAWHYIHSDFLKKNSTAIHKDAEAKSRIAYVSQAIRNILYVEATVREFSYFFVSVVKEITTNNDAKILRLEKNMDTLFSDEPVSEYNINYKKTENTRDFMYLLRLVKYENVSVVRKGVELIYGVFLTKKFHTFRLEDETKDSFSEFRTQIEIVLETAFKDYRLIHLKNYLKVESLEQWKRSNFLDFINFIQFLYTYTLLLNEQEHARTEENLEVKTKNILNNFFRTAGDPEFTTDGENYFQFKENNEKAGAFMVLKYDDREADVIREKKMLIAQATEPTNQRNHIINSTIDSNSLSYIMINGVSNKDFSISYDTYNDDGNRAARKKKPWIIWELQRSIVNEEVIWKSVRGNIYSIEDKIQSQSDLLKSIDRNGFLPNEFTEAIYLPSDTNYLTFIRLSDVNLNRENFESNGKAVICLYTDHQNENGTNNAEEIHRLRLSFCLLPLITRFINKNYDSSAILNSLISVRQQLVERERHHHGHKHLLQELVTLSKKTGNKNHRRIVIDVMHNLLASAEDIDESIDLYNGWGRERSNAGLLYSVEIDELGIIEISIEKLFEQIKFLYEVILVNVIEGTPVIKDPVRIESSFLVDENKVVIIPFKLFTVVISEALVNAKKHCRIENRDLTMIFSQEDGLLMLSLVNESREIPDVKMKRLNRSNKGDVHGLGLIDKISFGQYEKVSKKYCNRKTDSSSQTTYQYEIKIPIAIYNT
ncbi:hypothetical protein ACFFGT_10455 [Mucilaginibacter angelicae]|uniref:Uncharacterized protein n=1 Tax=Mucilaginibacter angelicae TaxID=869718 RepID=A0ABV6L5C0_9SPHI